MITFDNGLVQLHQADARQIPLADQSVHCVVTSPPYFGLRVYRADSESMIGLEETPEQWLVSMLEVMAEVGRVLRDDGVLWVNLGDSYSTHPPVKGQEPQRLNGKTAATSRETAIGRSRLEKLGGKREGNMLGIPWRFALAMQQAGWILRSDIIWAKKSAMPESLNGTRWEKCRVKVGASVRGAEDWPQGASLGTPQGDHVNGQIDGSAEYTDCPGCPKCADNDGYVLRQGSWRCTSAHEYIFQFVKKMNYYSDGEAVKTVNTAGTIQRAANVNNGRDGENKPSYDGKAYFTHDIQLSGANRRSVWRDIKPEPFGGEHYATFPSDLPRLCIQASTSEAGVCSECGAQWARVVEMTEEYAALLTNPDNWTSELGKPQDDTKRQPKGHAATVPQKNKTLAWRPTCQCQADKVPATVLDPFCGTATTCLAAMRLGRRSVGVDLSEDYLNMARQRLGNQTMPMEL